MPSDTSRLNGFGYALLQDHDSGQLCLVQCGSWFLMDAETRYANIELEMLAVVWAVSKYCFYLIKLQHFILLRDHCPLIPIINSYSLDIIENPHLQQLKEMVLPFLFTTVWHVEKLMCIPDFLSYALIGRPTPEDETCSDVANSFRSIVSLNTVITLGTPLRRSYILQLRTTFHLHIQLTQLLTPVLETPR